MRTDYESKQYVEIVIDDDGHWQRYNETEFLFCLQCTAHSYAGCFDPRVGGEPPSGPEFEVTSILVLVPKVNQKSVRVEFEAPFDLSWSQFVALVGEEIADHLYERAYEEAAETGDF